MVVPTVISVYLGIQFKNINKVRIESSVTENQVICFQADICALSVGSKWYRVNGIIDMSTTIPEEYRLPPENTILPPEDKSSEYPNVPNNITNVPQGITNVPDAKP